ncbi:complement factor D-like protein [Labeo rohita]|uniref:trypsin n=1 Tax=Labeo rohita TaxID=84645 RepID=A0A498N6D3_LABRO|nr:complement factor D-like protein [Labeo rohita]
MTIISLLLLASLLPHLTFTAHVDVGIVNGHEAKPHSRPYMVSIQENNEHVCGGFLISDEFVLTAAHCLYIEILTVVVGAHHLTDVNEGSVRIGVEYYHQHPKFNEKPIMNDIMLLRGDSGGPLVCGDIAVGITSFGGRKECNSREYPEVYTKISAYLPWIESIIANVK